MRGNQACSVKGGSHHGGQVRLALVSRAEEKPAPVALLLTSVAFVSVAHHTTVFVRLAFVKLALVSVPPVREALLRFTFW